MCEEGWGKVNQTHSSLKVAGTKKHRKLYANQTLEKEEKGIDFELLEMLKLVM